MVVFQGTGLISLWCNDCHLVFMFSFSVARFCMKKTWISQNDSQGNASNMKFMTV